MLGLQFLHLPLDAVYACKDGENLGQILHSCSVIYNFIHLERSFWELGIVEVLPKKGVYMIVLNLVPKQEKSKGKGIWSFIVLTSINK